MCSIWRLLVSFAGEEIYFGYKFDYRVHRCYLCKFGFQSLYPDRYRRSIHGWRRKEYAGSFPTEKASDVKRLKAIQKAIFENFKSFVSERRGEKIEGKNI